MKAILATIAIVVILSAGAVDAAYYQYLVPNAIFGFTDSLSDTGNLAIAVPNGFPASFPPYGMSIGQVTGRWSDGYLIIDFLNQFFTGSLETPNLAYTSAGYQSLGFGSAGSTVLPPPPPFNPVYLGVQVGEFFQYQNLVVSNNASAQQLFKDALYYIETGGNDINFALNPGNMSPEDVLKDVIPPVIQGLYDSIANLHVNASAVHFLVFNMPPAGCSPLYRTNYINDTNVDRFGCIVSANNLAKNFNRRLKNAVKTLRCTYPSGNFMYFDFYEAVMGVLGDADKFGFEDTTNACCGVGAPFNCMGGPIGCGCAPDVTPCSNPDTHISWDGVHYTQHLYKVIADKILSNDHVDTTTRLLNSNPCAPRE